jgi:hypothetical protein
MGKDIENRTWNCSLTPGTWLAIHAGRGYEFDGEDWLRETFPEHELPEAAQQPTGIVAIAQFCGNVTQSQSVWFGGPVGWQLEQVRALPQAVDCKGKQGLWKLLPQVKQQVLEAIA